MKKIAIKLTAFLAAAVLLFGVAGCSKNSGKYENLGVDTMVHSDNPLKFAKQKLYSFDYSDFTVNESILKDQLEDGFAYYYNLDVDDVFYEYRKEVGLDTKGGNSLNYNTSNWYGTGRAIIGQWLSGLCRMYAYTGDQKFKDRADEYVSIMAECVAINPGTVFDPVHYGWEKTLTGLMDAYEFCGNQTAYELVDKCMQFGMDTLGESRLLGANGDEWYTISGPCYRAAEMLGNSSYMIFASSWEYMTFWDIFYNNEDLFTESIIDGTLVYKPDPANSNFPEFFHAYSHLNSIVCAMECYKYKGGDYYLQTGKNFRDFMVNREIFATGGYGPEFEHLMPEDRIVTALETRNDHTETQCNAYAGYRLNNYLINYTGNSTYGDWEERMMYNMTLATIPMTEKGNVMYYSDYNVNGARKTNRTESWTCCAGSRSMVLLELAKSMYFHDTKNVYVNLFNNSVLEWSRNGNDIRITQDTLFPKSDEIKVTVNVSKEEMFAVKFRIPEWVQSSISVSINGENVPVVADEEGWLVVKNNWKDGDEIIVRMPLSLHISKFDVELSPYVLMEGPIVLCAQTEFTNPADQVTADTLIGRLERIRPLEYKVKGASEDILFKPFYTYQEGELYYMYIKQSMEFI